MSFLIGFLVAWTVMSAILLAGEEFDFLGIAILCKDSVLVCLTLPVTGPVLIVILAIRCVRAASKYFGIFQGGHKKNT